ncbi:hypothetical protein [Palleronia caenipelagi]|uniref:Uncharacterized protein n=1 Tax=Palleronia caenipelagi TaxID=2489174 RepID=A0A547PMQ4_9RHOB|nr:hypothetical protein [Palleronia caenipelagi]TRD15395.1 hypothetical protein FEV53_16565 [Palleronia caenipelagi]
MFLELIATIFAGLGAAGVAMALNKFTGGRLPRWIAPVAAGAAMLGVTIWSEMTWAERITDGLPSGVVVAQEVSETAFYRPWTYIWPQTTRLVAVDVVTAKRNEAAPETRLVDLYLFGRWKPTSRVPQLIDCTTGQRADVTDATLANPRAAGWRAIDETSELNTLVCEA